MDSSLIQQVADHLVDGGRYGNLQDADKDNLRQAVFAILWEKRAAIEAKADPDRYAKRVAWNAANRWVRAQRKQHGLLTPASASKPWELTEKEWQAFPIFRAKGCTQMPYFKKPTEEWEHTWNRIIDSEHKRCWKNALREGKFVPRLVIEEDWEFSQTVPMSSSEGTERPMMRFEDIDEEKIVAVF